MTEPDSAPMEPVEVEDSIQMDGQNSDTSDRPVIELFVKVSAERWIAPNFFWTGAPKLRNSNYNL